MHVKATSDCEWVVMGDDATLQNKNFGIILILWQGYLLRYNFECQKQQGPADRNVCESVDIAIYKEHRSICTYIYVSV